MKTLATHIEYHLMTRHYVFVPGIGAFMLHDVAGRIQTADDGNRITLCPPRREIRFSSFMTHDDGMLADSYMREGGLTYDEACSHIRKEVALLLSRLEQQGRCPLGRLGELTYDAECHLLFTGHPLHHDDPQTFGLHPVVMPEWRQLEAAATQAPAAPSRSARTTRDGDTIMIPIRRQWLKHAAVIILIIGCFFGNFSPQASRSDHASVFHTSLWSGDLHLNTLTPRSWDASWEDDSTFAVLTSLSVGDTIAAWEPAPVGDETPLATTDPVAADQVWTESRTVEALPDSEKLMANSPNGKLYYIIVASCASPDEADRVIRRLGRQGYNEIGLLERDGRYRLYINYFALKTEAETFLNQLRQNSPFADAWLLPVRANALSHIKKNQDNEPLPMELSHLNQRTARDQG